MKILFKCRHMSHCVSNHWNNDCLFNNLFKLSTMKHQSSSFLSLLEGYPLVTDRCPSHRDNNAESHDDVIKWKHFPCYWSCVRGIHRSPVNSPHKGQWRGTMMFSLMINDWVSNREAGDWRRYSAHYDVTLICLDVMTLSYRWVSARKT